MNSEPDIKIPFQSKLEEQRPIPLPLEQLRYLACRSLAESKTIEQRMPVEKTGCVIGAENLRPEPFDLMPVSSASLPEPEEFAGDIAINKVQSAQGELEAECAPSHRV